MIHDKGRIMTKYKIKIIIPNSKHSERLPRKNEYLRKFTLDWLNNEIKTLPQNWQVEVVELRNDNVPVDTWLDGQYNYKINPVYCPDEVSSDMKKLLNWYEEKYNSTDINPDFCVLLQLTQPKRRQGLLFDALNEVMANDGHLCVSYVKMPFADKWRIITADKWNEKQRYDTDPHLKLYDGAIYAWANFTPQDEEYKRYFFQEGNYNCALLWNMNKAKHIIENYTGEVIDIDEQKDLEKFYRTLEP